MVLKWVFPQTESATFFSSYWIFKMPYIWEMFQESICLPFCDSHIYFDFKQQFRDRDSNILCVLSQWNTVKSKGLESSSPHQSMLELSSFVLSVAIQDRSSGQQMHPWPANYGRTWQQLWPPSILCILLTFLIRSNYSDINMTWKFGRLPSL